MAQKVSEINCVPGSEFNFEDCSNFSPRATEGSNKGSDAKGGKNDVKNNVNGNGNGGDGDGAGSKPGGNTVEREHLPCHFSDQIYTRRFLAFMIITVAALLVISALIFENIRNLVIFSRDTGFPDPILFIIGSIVSFIILAYVVYYATTAVDQCPVWIFWMYLLFLVFYTFWVLNLELR